VVRGALRWNAPPQTPILRAPQPSDKKCFILCHGPSLRCHIQGGNVSVHVDNVFS
jgi:hypothetical protein